MIKKFLLYILNFKFTNLFKADNEISRSFWKNHKNWQISKVSVERFNNQKQFLLTHYIPILDKNQVICDYACACGDWSFMVSPYVKHIDAYDISPSMIEKAKQEAEKRNITNINFQVSEAETFEFEKVYDSIMVLGLFTCIFDDSVCENFIKKIGNAVKPKSYIVIKDTISEGEPKIGKPNLKYRAIYRNKQKYIEMYTRNGFELVTEEYIYKEGEICSVMAIFRKV